MKRKFASCIYRCRTVFARQSVLGILSLLAIVGCTSLSSVSLRAGEALKTVFANPPESAKPWVFWYWLNAAVTKPAITADLKAMKANGIEGAYLMPVKGETNPPMISPPAQQLSPEFWSDVRFAFQEADRLGVKLAMHACDGFTTAGGPWITPAMSMQHVVWTESQIEGGKRIEMTLPEPQVTDNYYRDIAVFAFPSEPGAGVSTRTVQPVVTTNASDSSAQFLADGPHGKTFVSKDPCWIQYAFKKPFTCRSIQIRVPPTTGIQYYTYFANRFRVEVSDDGEHFHQVARLHPPRHGWQDGDSVTHSIPAVTARYFRFYYDSSGAQPGAEDMDSAKWKRVLKIQALVLSSEARINEFAGKTGDVWRVAPPTTSKQVPDGDCIPLNKIINISTHVDAKGRLRWTAPPGKWTILRMGHTSTGKTNYAGGGGVGLECDKFDPNVARFQFEHWFGEAIRQAGPALAGRVLKVFHVDSWESGSQNWSHVFRAEFKKRRGYDPLPYLPVMAGIPIQSADVSERFLRDVRETISELVVDNFYKPMAKLAHEHGCKFSAECVAPTMTSDGMAHYAIVDIPMGEFWLRSPTNDKLNDILDAVSGAHVYGKAIAQAEAFTELQLKWDEAPYMLKSLGDRNYCYGINRFVYHVFVHNPWMNRKPGMTLGGVGLYFQRNQTWWKPGKAWVSYADRCQALLQQGHPVKDFVVFTGDSAPRRALVPWHLSSTFPAFFPKNDPRLERKIIEAGDWVDPFHGYSYDSINRDALLRLVTVRNGRIVLPGGASYSMLVMPAVNPMEPTADELTPAVLAKVDELIHDGATVLFGVRPKQSPSLHDYPACDRTVEQITARLWPLGKNADGEAHSVGKGRVVTGPFTKDNFASLGYSPDFKADESDGKPAAGVAWTHRAGPGWDLYFVSNQQAEARRLTLSLRVAGRVPELWDPVSEETRDAGDWRIRAGRTELPLQFPPNGSIFIIFERRTDATHGTGAPNGDQTRLVQTLSGPWQVSFNPALGGPKSPIEFDRLESWTRRSEEGIRYYSGTAAYKRRFEWNRSSHAGQQVWLYLGRVDDIASVTVNGISCGVAWTDPYRVDVTHALEKGTNTIRINVTNTWFNRLAGDQKLPADKRITWTTAPADRVTGNPLLESGLLGPVTLRIDRNP